MEIRPILSALARSKTGALLIAAQVALTLALLANALPIVEQRLSLSQRPTGADEANVFYTRLFGFKPGIDVKAMVADDYALIRSIPGVVAVARSNQAPLFQSGWNLSISVRDGAEREYRGLPSAAFYYTDGSLVDALANGEHRLLDRLAALLHLDAQRGEAAHVAGGDGGFVIVCHLCDRGGCLDQFGALRQRVGCDFDVIA